VSLLGPREEEAVRELFAGLERDVELELLLGPESTPVTVLAGSRELDFGAETKALLESIAGLSNRVTLTVSETDEPGGRYPQLTIAGAFRYHGLPWGYELSTLVYGIAEAGRAEPSLSAESTAKLDALPHDVALEVYVTPT
jgi:alkyl hydroperoxide reductase subunit AhpF